MFHHVLRKIHIEELASVPKIRKRSVVEHAEGKKEKEVSGKIMKKMVTDTPG